MKNVLARLKSFSGQPPVTGRIKGRVEIGVKGREGVIIKADLAYFSITKEEVLRYSHATEEEHTVSRHQEN